MNARVEKSSSVSVGGQSSAPKKTKCEEQELAFRDDAVGRSGDTRPESEVKRVDDGKEGPESVNL